MAEQTNHTQKTYPAFYEKFIPIVIGLLAVLIFGMLVYTVAVGTGMLQFG